MARITCSKSGVIFSCEHMPIALAAPSYVHPLFHVPQKKLIALAGNWAAGKLSPTESYLLYLALLDSTDLIQWRTHATYHNSMDAIVANNMETLLHIIAKINIIQHPNFALPSFAIGRDTADLSNSHHWIQAWITNYNDWYESYLDSRKQEEIKDRLSHREEALQRLIKSSTPVDAYASTLAEWASTAGSFPTYDTNHPVTKQPVPLCDYWKQIIKTIANDDKLWRFPRADIVELIDHCEDNIQHGNIYAHTLMKYLRNGLRKYDDYLGFGDISVSATSFTVMPANASVHEINRAALLSTAPESEPKKHQFPSTIAWLKAYTKWKVSQGQGNRS